MFFTNTEVYNYQPNTEICKRGADHKPHRLETTDQVFMEQGVHLDMEDIFKYIGRFFPNNNDDWPSVHTNLCKDQNIWARISWIMARDSVTPRVLGMFYKAVVKSIILF